MPRNRDLGVTDCPREGIGSRIGNPLIVGAASIGLTQKEDDECGIDEQHIFYRVAFFLAAITTRLLGRILGALDAPFGAITAKRGETGADAGATAGGWYCLSSDH
jgi:hypothetical protein